MIYFIIIMKQVNIGSLNARHLHKSGEPHKRSLFIRHITQQSLHILAMQET